MIPILCEMLERAKEDERRDLKGALRFIEEMSIKGSTAYCILVAVTVLVIDYVTGKQIQFPILYLLPAGMAAWSGQKVTAYAIAILLPSMRVGFHFPWHETRSLYLSAVNALIRILALILYVYSVGRIASQTRQLQRKVKVLEGILPICASCKRIRNEKGDYEQIEKYITQHSEASFSHGVCSECAKELYPEYLKDENK